MIVLNHPDTALTSPSGEALGVARSPSDQMQHLPVGVMVVVDGFA
jgi:hypothetical protein